MTLCVHASLQYFDDNYGGSGASEEDPYNVEDCGERAHELTPNFLSFVLSLSWQIITVRFMKPWNSMETSQAAPAVFLSHAWLIRPHR
jgi:hypothetical protein